MSDADDKSEAGAGLEAVTGGDAATAGEAATSSQVGAAGNSAPPPVAEKNSGDFETKRNPLPNVGDLLFVGICWLLLFLRPNFLFSDGSTGWHLVTGMTILASGKIPHSDIMSYTFPGKEWVAYEWLSDTIMALLVKIGGLNLLALVVTVAIAGLILSIYQRMRAGGCHVLTSMVLCFIGLLASANHWLVRPHIFTFWGVYLYVTRLEEYYLDKISFKRLCVWLFAYMVLWVNCHPAFLMGFGICGFYMIGTFIKVLSADDEESRKKFLNKFFRLCFLLVALVGASLINPYGLQLYHYIAEYLHGTSVLAQNEEFKSPNFHSFNIHAICLEILFFCLTLGLIKGGKKVTLPYFITTIVYAHLALSAVRNISLFAFIVMPLLGKLFACENVGDINTGAAEAPNAPNAAPGTSILASKFGRFTRAFDNFSLQERLSDMHILPIAYVLVMGCIAVFAGGNLATIHMRSGFDPESQPIQTLTYIKEKKLEAKEGMSMDNWGGLIRYQLDMPVFIDDRQDFYGEKFYNEYGTIVEVRPGYLALLDQHRINWILFPKASQLVLMLKTKPDWKVVSEDQASSLMVRTQPIGK